MQDEQRDRQGITFALGMFADGYAANEVKRRFRSLWPHLPISLVDEALVMVHEATVDADARETRALVQYRLMEIYKRCKNEPRYQLKALEQLAEITGLNKPMKVEHVISRAEEAYLQALEHMTAGELEVFAKMEGLARAKMGDQVEHRKFPPLRLADGRIIEGTTIRYGEEEAIEEEVEEIDAGEEIDEADEADAGDEIDEEDQDTL